MPMTGSATVGSGPRGEFKIDVKASTDFEYDYTFIDTNAGKGCFDVNIPYIADRFRDYGRCVLVCDARVYDIYGEGMRAYFQHHGMGLEVPRTGYFLDHSSNLQRWDPYNLFCSADWVENSSRNAIFQPLCPFLSPE